MATSTITTTTITAPSPSSAELFELNSYHPPSTSCPSPAFPSPTDTSHPHTAPPAEDETRYPVGLQFWLIVLCNALVLTVIGLDQSFVGTVVPSVTDDFGTVSDVGWYSSAFRLGSCSFQFAFGRAYKLFRVRPVLLLAQSIFVLGTLLTALSPSSRLFVMGRAVCGLGCAGMIQGCFAMLVHVMPLRKRPMWSSIFGCFESVAQIVAPVLGGAMVDRLGWRWCFWVNLPVGGLALILVATALRIHRQDTDTVGMTWRRRLYELDVVGTCLFLPSLACLFLALSWAGTRRAWDSVAVIGLLVGFVLLLAMFAYQQYRRGDAATLPFRILCNRSVLSGFLFSLCTNSAMQIFEYYLPTYFQSVRELTATQSGYLMLPLLIGFMLALLAQGYGVSYVGYYSPFMYAGSILMPIFAGLLTTLDLETSLARIVLYTGAAGFAGGIGFQSPQSAVQASLPAADASPGLAIIIFAQNFGPAIFIFVGQSIFANLLARNLAEVVPGLSPEQVSETGLSAIKSLAGPGKATEALTKLGASLVQTWYLPVGLACTTMIGTLRMEWKSVKDKK